MNHYATHILAQQAAAIALSPVPDEVLQIACRALIDTLGVALAGSNMPVVQRLKQTVMSEGKASTLGGMQRINALDAARLNGCAAHALDFDDNCYAGFVHGSAVIIPAALAVAQQYDSDGASLLTAIVAGSECQYRLGEALGQPLYQRGWWTTGVLGVVGAAVAAAHLLRLDTTQVAHAIALALAATGGSKSAFGSDAKAVMAGLAAERGIQAALMAQAGITGPLNTLEHPYGLPGLMNEARWQPKQLTAAGWRLLQPGLDVKRIPVCLSAHAAVDAVVTLIHQHAIALDEITQIHCDVPQIVIANLVYADPMTPQQAQFSLPYAIAATLFYGELTLNQLTLASLAPAALHALMAKVSMTTSPQWQHPQRLQAAPEGASVTLHLQSGRQLTCRVDRPLGNATNPLSNEALDDKFLSCAQRVLPAAQSHRLLTQLRQVTALPSMAQLSPLLENPDHEL
ncbi:2-methylcitrate dehydratase PrpD [Raoultella sp. BIGb0138]|uniref:MmgE/PrpD family protein n=1 Tax=Raoultella sp. BIGb0138 TaxID=2485115 RepID=UPI001048674E|nr:MmgE/PrpD family protein [Raoultella sp. BIGb0138]TCW12367.1 2-methylcitrate dehydratase PrpD [Raoultella sp. BIGb0138]